MKKLKLIMAFCALVLGWSNAMAQNPGDDYTSSITNPTFTGNADGWTITGNAKYFGGTGFDGTASFIELTNWSSSWDATISQTVTGLPNGYFLVKAAGQMSGTSDCWMKLVANDAESRFSRNGDSNGNILADGTETAIGSGVAGWRYTSVIAKVTDGSLAISCVGHSNVAERWANFDHVTLTFLGTEIAPNTDVTEYISNWDFWGCFNNEFNGWTFETSGGNTWVHGNTAVEFWNNNLSATFDYYQTINNLPEGRYQISASMWSTQGTPNGNSGVYGTSNDVTVFAGVTDDCDDANLHTYTTEGIAVKNGTLRLGVKNNGTRSSNWFGVDWIKLQYMGKVVQDYAVALPDGGVMAADTWYYFDIAVAGNEYNATADDLSKIICTDDGNTLVSAASGNVTLTATNNSFAAKRYYVKSSSANNLEIGVASYTYTVSEASVDKTYIQPSQTVTVSFTASTNDPGATLDQDYSGVTFDDVEINVTPGASGFTFTAPANLAVNTEHTLYIPASAIGYDEGTTYNAEQSITLNTPAVFDGTYFLKVAATYDGSSEGTSAAVGKYLARGLNYGTHATLDKYGLPVQIATDASNVTTIQAYDTKRYFFHANTYDCYADQTSLAASCNFTVTMNNGKLLIHNNTMGAGTYLKYNTSAANDANIGIFDDGTGTNNGPIIMWTTENASTHATVMQSYKDGQAASAAAAAYASGNYESLNGITTVSALEAELEANYIKGDFVSPSPIESVSEKYQGDQPGSGNITETVYSNSINITEPGFYKFSMQAFYRAASNDVTQNMHTNSVDFPPVTLFFGNSETQIKSVYDEGNAEQIVEGWGDVTYNGQHYPNNMDASLKMFKADKYHNDVYFYASEPGEYTYGVKYMGFASANAQWFIYSPESVEISSYAAAADAADYTALQNAIDAYDAATWGFEAGEYAPYNNVEAMENIDAAKAIDKNVDNSKLLVNSLTTKLALSAANVGEVNAVYDGTFAIQDEHTTPPTELAGWNNPEGLRQLIKNTTTYSGLNSATDNAGFFAWGSTALSYGNTTGYTMPLAAHTIYELRFKTCGWADGDMGYVSASVLNASSEGLAATNSATATKRITESDPWVEFSAVFETGEAGDYTLGMWTSKHAVITDITLYQVPAQSKTITAAGWATYCSPYALDFSGDIANLTNAYIVTGATGIALNLEEIDGTIPANTGILLEGEGEVVIPVAASSSTDVSENKFQGVLENTEISANAGYVLMADPQVGFYQNEKAFTVGANTAYLPANFAGAVVGARAAYFFGGVTGVANVEAVAEAKAQEGKFIENGKLVIVKAGKKFNASGAQMK